MGLFRDLREVRTELKRFEVSRDFITLLKEEIIALRLQNKELHDRLMAKDYRELVESRISESEEADSSIQEIEPNYEAFVGTVGDINKEE